MQEGKGVFWAALQKDEEEEKQKARGKGKDTPKWVPENRKER